MVHSLPDTWVQMRVNMTHKKNIKNFDDIRCHLELEVECLEVSKSFRAYVAELSSRWRSKPKKGKKFINATMPKGSASVGVANKKKKDKYKKKDKARMVYYNCAKTRHTAHECTKPKEVMLSPDLTKVFSFKYCTCCSFSLYVNCRL